MIEARWRRSAREPTHARVELAALPDLIRGYEQVKLANVERYRARAQDLIQQPSDGRTRVAMEGEAR